MDWSKLATASIAIAQISGGSSGGGGDSKSDREDPNPRNRLIHIDRHAGLIILSYLSPVSLSSAMGVSRKWSLPAHNSLWKAHCLADSIPDAVTAEVKTTPSTNQNKASVTAAPAPATVPDRHFYGLYRQFGGAPLTPIPFASEDGQKLSAIGEYQNEGTTNLLQFRVRGGPRTDPASISMYTHRLAVLCACIQNEYPERAKYWSADRIVSVGIHGTRYHHTARLFTVLNLFATDSHMQLYGDGRYATTIDEYCDPKHRNYRIARRVRDACSPAGQSALTRAPVRGKTVFEELLRLGITVDSGKSPNAPKPKPIVHPPADLTDWPDPAYIITPLDVDQLTRTPPTTEFECNSFVSQTESVYCWQSMHGMCFSYAQCALIFVC